MRHSILEIQIFMKIMGNNFFLIQYFTIIQIAACNIIKYINIILFSTMVKLYKT